MIINYYYYQNIILSKMMNLGFKYQPHNENHYSQDNKHTIKKEIIARGRCLNHQDIQTSIFGIPRECKRCAKEYELNIEIEEIKNKIKMDKKLTDIVDNNHHQEVKEPYVGEIEIQTLSDVLTSEIELQTQTFSEVVKVDIGTQTTVLIKEIETQTFSEVVKVDTEQQPEVLIKEIETQPPMVEIKSTTKQQNEVTKESKIVKKYLPILASSMAQINPIIDKNIKENVIDGIMYTLCEVKLPGYYRMPYRTQKWFKIRQHTDVICTPSCAFNINRSKKQHNISIKNCDDTEYLIGDIAKIRQMLNSSYTFLNGATIVTEYPPLICPSYKMVNGEWVNNTHINNKTFSTREWCDFSYINAEKVLSYFKV